MINRLYRFCVLLFALGWSSSAWALTEYSYDSFLTWNNSIDSACASAFAKSHPGAQVFVPSQNQGKCQALVGGSTITKATREERTVAVVTPPPSCAKTSFGQVDVTTAWATGPSVGSAIAKKIVPDGGLKDVAYCAAGCQVKTSDLSDAANASKVSCSIAQTATNGYNRIHCSTPFELSGDACTVVPQGSPSGLGSYPSPLDQPPPPTAAGDNSGKCPTGSTPGGVDPTGMTICVGKSTAPSAPAPTSSTTKPAVSSTDSAGNAVSTVESKTTNSDGSVTTTTTTTTTAADGSKTVASSSSTSAKPAASGGGQGTADRPEDKTDLCKLHPELNVCKNSQVQGQCALITCDGDAIQCATLRAAATMQCAQQADKDELSKLASTTLGSSILSGADPMKAASDANLKGTTVDLSSPNLDSSGFASSSCFPAKSFTVAGQTVTMSFDTVCDKIQPLRYAVMAVCTLIAYLIVSKSVLGA